MKSSTSEFIAEVDAVNHCEWAKIIESFDDSSIYQTWAYGSALWGEKKLSHLVLKRQGEVVAAAQVRIERIPGFSVGIAYVKWGPLWRNGTTNYDHLENIVRCLRDEYMIKRGLLVRIVPKDASAETAFILMRYGLARNVKSTAYRSLLIDLSHPVEELRSGMSKSWRYYLKRAEQHELDIIEGTSDELFEIFVTLYREMRAIKRYAEFFDVEKYKTIQKNLPSGLQMKVLICSYRRDPISGTVISRMGPTALCLLAATGSRGRELGAAYRVQWKAVELLKAQGTRWYDLGGINPEHNPGCYGFKAHLAGKLGVEVQYIGQFEASYRLKSSLTVKAADYLRDTYRRAIAHAHEVARAIPCSNS